MLWGWKGVTTVRAFTRYLKRSISQRNTAFSQSKYNIGNKLVEAGPVSLLPGSFIIVHTSSDNCLSSTFRSSSQLFPVYFRLSSYPVSSLSKGLSTFATDAASATLFALVAVVTLLYKQAWPKVVSDVSAAGSEGLFFPTASKMEEELVIPSPAHGRAATF